MLFRSHGPGGLRLRAAIEWLPELPPLKRIARAVPAAFVPPPVTGPAGEGSLFVGSDHRIFERVDGGSVPVSYGGR